ncbi:MAG: uroporphyrinogen-III C-methyltransferase [Burkholderiaceae bacterium]
MNADLPDPLNPQAGSGEPPAVPRAPMHAAPPNAAQANAAQAHAARPGSSLAVLALVVALVALVGNLMLWQRVSGMREQLARQSADSLVQATEARAVARQAQELARDTAARLAVSEVKLSEVALQRNQLEDLIQSLSRSRDENLVVDIESAVRLAQQQAQLTGSVEPLLAALKSAQDRVERAAQPRLAQLQRAIARDIARIAGATVSDTPTLLARIDELLRMADEVPLANAVAAVNASGTLKRESTEATPDWWGRVRKIVGDEARSLLRVSRIEQPDAALLSPEQSFFVRENLKLKLLNARLGILARQLESARADMAAAAASLNKYFDPTSRKTQAAASLLHQVQGQMKTMALPRVDETLAALTTAAAGR